MVKHLMVTDLDRPFLEGYLSPSMIFLLAFVILSLVVLEYLFYAYIQERPLAFKSYL